MNWCYTNSYSYTCIHWIYQNFLLFVLQYFWLFLLIRGLVGIGEASYSTIAISRHVCQGNQNKDAYVLLFCYTSGQVGKLVPEPVYMYRMCLCVTKSLTTFCVTYVLISVYIFFTISPCSKPSLLDCNYPNYMI